ncbi:MAG: hypothetical protein ACERKJ_05990 [Candidatus Dadabacteria bacterium]
MKKCFVLSAFIIDAALYVFTVAWSYEYIDAHSTKSAGSPVRKIGASDPIRGNYVETDHTSFYTYPKGTPAQDLYDKNVEDADEPDYYAFGVESSSKSSYILTQNDGVG